MNKYVQEQCPQNFVSSFNIWFLLISFIVLGQGIQTCSKESIVHSDLFTWNCFINDKYVRAYICCMMDIVGRDCGTVGAKDTGGKLVMLW